LIKGYDNKECPTFVTFDFYCDLHLSGTVALELQHTRSRSFSQVLDQNGQKEGANKLELPKGISIQNLNKRPSIAPVPAVIDAAGIEITVESEESEDDSSVADEEPPWVTPTSE
jgi:hypothetical protein